jgi:glutamate synthase (NADPH/NADH) large chain
LGLAEAQQTLVKNKLRSRVLLQADGQLKTGKDVAIATLLGAEEWGVATAALVVEGCIMMRKCHLNTCPVGVATQDPELRKRFNGAAEHVVNFIKFLTSELREIMAELGYKSIEEMVGQADVLKMREDIQHWKYSKLDLSPVLYKEPTDKYTGIYKQEEQDHGIADVLDWKLMEDAANALTKKEKVLLHYPIKNTDRTTGTMLSNEITKIYGAEGLPPDTIHLKFTGTAGQSFGAFNTKGIKLELEGDANDYFGKGLSGATLVVYPHKDSSFIPEENIVIGNVAFYGATSGKAFIRGKAGERFAVRNSGATAVVEGVGDHGCEYMTGGTVVILGETGRNFAAGMSGGIAYVYDSHDNFHEKCNHEMVDLDSLDQQDHYLLQTLLEEHLQSTNSSVAKYLLSDLEIQIDRFIKVFPRDYKLALSKQKVGIELNIK